MDEDYCGGDGEENVGLGAQEKYCGRVSLMCSSEGGWEQEEKWAGAGDRGSRKQAAQGQRAGRFSAGKKTPFLALMQSKTQQDLARRAT